MSDQHSTGKNELSRRDFLKLLAAGGTALTFAPFVPWGNFMPNPDLQNLTKAKAMLEDGTQANIKTFPINHAETITYPKTGDRVLDEEAFRKWDLIRFPKERGGAKISITSFVAYSKICLHLWCLWKYWPEEGRKRIECPCHGSMYDIGTGKAFAGPASLQAAPSNVLPKLTLEADKDGFINILPAKFGVNDNGVVAYGRFLKA